MNSFHSFEAAALFCIFKKDYSGKRGAPNFFIGREVPKTTATFGSILVSWMW